MSIIIEQTDVAIRETFYSMEEGIEYVLNDFWFAETNRVRKEYNYSPFNDKRQYKFTRKGNKIFVNNNFVIDFDGKSNLAFTFAFASASAFTWAFSFSGALQYSGFEKLNNDSCEGKVVEIDGKKYKLTAV